MKYRTFFNSKDLPKNYEVPVGPSKTIPDQSLSIQEILKRYASGLPLGGERVPFYQGDDDDELIDLPDWNRLDLAEREEMLEQAKNHLNDIKAQLNQKARLLKEKEAEQGTTVQRTSGGAAGASTTDEPDNPISVKTGGAGAQPRDTGTSAGKSTN